MNLADYIERKLAQAQEAGLRRSLREVEGFVGTEVTIAGRNYISFASNDYLGLARHPEVVAAARDALERYGAGAGASRLIIGNLSVHHELERRVAGFKGRHAAAVFATGYLANLGAICALVGHGDAVISDEKNHASIVDACRLSRAEILIYRHLDMEDLRAKLELAAGCTNKLVVTESVFSVDGDIAPVDEVARLAKKYGAWTMIDEAHATGVIGENGRGAEELFNCTGEIDVVMGTLSKALGSQGGFIAGDESLAELLINVSRPLIYSTGLSPAAAAAAAQALEIIEREPVGKGGKTRRQRLFDNLARVNELAVELNLRGEPSRAPIVPLTIGDEKEAARVHQAIMEKGLIIPLLRYPTVPMGEALLRVSVSSEHTDKQIDRLGEALQAVHNR